MLYIVKIAIQFKGCCRIIAIVVDSLFLEFYYPNFVSVWTQKEQLQFKSETSAFPEVVLFQGK